MNDDQFEVGAKTATCILAPACFALGAEVFADYEGGLVGVQSSNINLETSNFTYSLCVGMLFFDAVLYGVLAWYLDNVLPTEFGTQLPLYFPLLPSYWLGASFSFTSTSSNNNNNKRKRRNSKRTWLEYIGFTASKRRYSQLSTDDPLQQGQGQGQGGDGDGHGVATLETGLIAEDGEDNDDDEQHTTSDRKGGEYIEAVSADLRRQISSQTCLSIRGLRKVFQSAAGGDDRVAVDKLDMNLYQGHVTVLLGHNGAGKSCWNTIEVNKWMF